MDAGVRKLYEEIICGYLEHLSIVRAIKPDTIVMISLLDTHDLDSILNFLRHVHRFYGPNHHRSN